jgi:hypothetical protein
VILDCSSEESRDKEMRSPPSNYQRLFTNTVTQDLHDSSIEDTAIILRLYRRIERKKMISNLGNAKGQEADENLALLG